MKFETILKYHERYLCQISRTNHAIICLYYYVQKVYNFTCRYFKLSWNTTALCQSNCRNFSCSSINANWITDFILLQDKFLQFGWLRAVVFQLNLNTYMWKLQTFCGYKQIIPWFLRDIWHKYHSWYFKIVSNFTLLKAREITYTPNANMADLSAGPGLVARKRG